MSEEYNKMITCSCCAEGILIRRFDDEGLIWLSLWRSAMKHPSFRQKLRYCYEMLRWGYSADEVVFTKEAANTLALELTK